MARDQRSDLRGISIIAENKPHANHKTHMQTMKVYNWPDHRSFAKVFFFFFFFDHSVVFTCSKVIKRFEAMEFADRYVSEKL